MPRVSVIMNCLNGERYLEESIGSVFAQTFEDWEIIFWDNASTDNTREIATSYGPKVRYFRADQTTDLGLARSRAYKQATGDYVALLDADDIWLPDKLQTQLNIFEHNPDLGLVYCDSIHFDGKGDHFRLFQAVAPKRGDVFGDLLASNFIFTSTMMFSQKSLNQLDYVFDEKFARVQDYELTLRIAYNFPIDYTELPLSKWRMYQDSKEWWQWKNSLVPRSIELKQALESLIEKYPSIETDYSNELNHMYKGLDYNSGIVAWQNGRRNEARTHLSRYLGDRKYAFVFVCTFLMPYGVFFFLKTIYKNIITSRLKPKYS